MRRDFALPAGVIAIGAIFRVWFEYAKWLPSWHWVLTPFGPIAYTVRAFFVFAMVIGLLALAQQSRSAAGRSLLIVSFVASIGLAFIPA